jgi:hypothetical protein
LTVYYSVQIELQWLHCIGNWTKKKNYMRKKLQFYKLRQTCHVNFLFLLFLKAQQNVEHYDETAVFFSKISLILINSIFHYMKIIMLCNLYRINLNLTLIKWKNAQKKEIFDFSKPCSVPFAFNAFKKNKKNKTANEGEQNSLSMSTQRTLTVWLWPHNLFTPCNNVIYNELMPV